MARKINQKGQVALWIIVGILIVGGIIILISLREPKPVIIVAKTTEINSIVEKCVKESTTSTLDKMLPQGGFVNPVNYAYYNKTNISYLCLNEGAYKPCIMQHPLFIRELENEIKKNIFSEINDCFESIKQEAQDKGETITLGEQNLNLTLGDERVYVKIDRKVLVTKGEDIKNYEKFNYEINYPIYNLAKVAIEIANQEAKYCNFEYVGYMILFPKFKITKTITSDSSIIYTIKDINSGKQLNIAIRGCVIASF